jgi:hypothetical protein
MRRDRVARALQIVGGSLKRLLIEIREQDRLPETLPASDRDADATGPNHHDNIFRHLTSPRDAGAVSGPGLARRGN